MPAAKGNPFRKEGKPPKHTIPVIDRMMDVLGELERDANGMNIREITGSLKQPRTTIYRILNTLQAHEVVRRDDEGFYHLGRRLLSLAIHATSRYTNVQLTSVAQPFMDKLAGELGEGVKLSVMDDEGPIVLVAAQGRREYALTVAAGQRMAIHASAAGKLILAHQPDDVIAFWLSQSLPAYTRMTIADPKRLQAALTAIRKSGWSMDEGESAPSVQAIAAPVLDKDGQLVAALSVPFLAGTTEKQIEKIKSAAIRCARNISGAIRR
jgi:DNA-binding IclR family transcriptional regulator